jgi:hypothetical protein
MKTGIFKLGDVVESNMEWLGRTPLLIISDEGMMYKAMYIEGDLDRVVRPIFKGTALYEKVGSVFKEN